MNERRNNYLDDGWVRFRDVNDWLNEKPVLRSPLCAGVVVAVVVSLVLALNATSPDVLKFFCLIIVGAAAIVLIVLQMVRELESGSPALPVLTPVKGRHAAHEIAKVRRNIQKIEHLCGIKPDRLLRMQCRSCQNSKNPTPSRCEFRAKLRMNKLKSSLFALAFLVPGTADAADCEDWNSGQFFEVATVTDVERCLAAGAKLETRNPSGATPLHLAAMTSAPAVVQALINAGSDVNALADYGVTPLHLAALSGSRAVVQTLIDAGANVNARGGACRTITPLDFGRFNSMLVVHALLRAGAEPGPEEGSCEAGSRNP